MLKSYHHGIFFTILEWFLREFGGFFFVYFWIQATFLPISRVFLSFDARAWGSWIRCLRFSPPAAATPWSCLMLRWTRAIRACSATPHPLDLKWTRWSGIIRVMFLISSLLLSLGFFVLIIYWKFWFFWVKCSDFLLFSANTHINYLNYNAFWSRQIEFESFFSF